jgi:hypothetical protein
MEKTVPLQLKITVTIAEDVQPDLMRTLMGTRKGPPRAARLILLAYRGLIAERDGSTSSLPIAIPLQTPMTQDNQSDAKPLDYQPMLGEQDVLDLIAGLGTTPTERHR